VLKKAGIVVATAAAGLLAMAPLAFADGHHHGDDGDGGNHQKGIANIQNTNVQVPVQACNNSVVEGVLGILAKDQKNKDSHDGDCDQDNSADN
jgi:hypothetical protein